MRVTVLADGRSLQDFLFFVTEALVHAHRGRWEAARSCFARARRAYAQAALDVET